MPSKIPVWKLIDSIAFVAALPPTSSSPTQEEHRSCGYVSNTTIINRLGWNGAKFACGFDINNRLHIPSEEILSDIVSVSQSLPRNRAPSKTEYDALGQFSSGTASNRFGSYNNAIKRSGLCPTNRRDIPKEELASDIRRVASSLDEDRGPTIEEYAEEGRFSPNPIKQRFGTYSRALEYCGFPTNHHYNISDETLLSDLVRVSDSLHLGRGPTKVEYDAHGKFGSQTIYERFGSYTTALEQAGLNPNVWVDVDKNSIIKDLQRIADSPSKSGSVGSKEYRTEGKYPLSAVIRTFGKYNIAIEAAGLSPVMDKEVDEDILVEDIQQVATLLKLDRAPKGAEYDRYGTFSKTTLYNYFGSLWDAMIKAGLEPNPSPTELSGEEHPHWDGGRFPYGPGFTKSKKELVRERQKRRCAGCGVHESELEQLLPVHHKQKARNIDDPEKRNHEDNLIALCGGTGDSPNCHAKYERMAPLCPQSEFDTSVTATEAAADD